MMINIIVGGNCGIKCDSKLDDLGGTKLASPIEPANNAPQFNMNNIYEAYKEPPA